MQFLFSAPIGRLSDRVGRRPVLLVSVALISVGYLIFGLATSIPMLFVARMISGLGGANLGAAQAIIAVDPGGENAIFLHSGANNAIPRAQLDAALTGAETGDWFVCQNETVLQLDGVSLARKLESTKKLIGTLVEHSRISCDVGRPCRRGLLIGRSIVQHD